MSAMMLVLLVGLGNWQLRRLAWKEGLIASIEARSKAPPVMLDEAAALWRKTGDVEYLRVRAKGRFLHDKERYYFAPEGGRTGWHVYTPLRTAGGRLLMVNRGFVPQAAKAPAARASGQIAGQVTITGLLRKPGRKGMFTPDNNLAKNAWYWRDLDGMLKSLGAKDKPAGNGAYPFFLEAGPAAVPPGGLPRPGVTRLTIRNKHLQYAITWYGLALTLIGVFTAFAWPRLKAARNSD